MSAEPSPQEIWQQIQLALVELFDLPEETLKPDANLVEDLEMDSIDVVDLAARLQDITGERMRLEDLKDVGSLNDVYAVVLRQLGLEYEPPR